MKVIRSFVAQPFIVATSVAAFFHSTWSLGTLFNGHEPALGLAWLYWVAPAALIAFAIDIGLVSVSADMRGGERTPAKYVTFGVLAASTYLLQLLYIGSHMPVVALGPGVVERAQGAVLFARDFSVYFLPALLPLSTTIYTFSYHRHSEPERPPIPAPTVTVEPPATPAIEAPHSIALAAGESEPEHAPIEQAFACENCGKVYGSLNALNAHRRAHRVAVHLNGRSK